MIMTLDEMLTKAKTDNDLTTYEALDGVRATIESLEQQLEDEKGKHEEDNKARDTEIAQLKDKTWELLTRGNSQQQQPVKQAEPKPITGADIVSKWKMKSY